MLTILKIVNFLLQSIEMSSPKKIKSPRLIKIIRELKSLEDAIEKVNKIKELETRIIIESTKRKRIATKREKIININVPEEALRIETLKRRIKKKPVNLKMKNKEIGKRKI